MSAPFPTVPTATSITPSIFLVGRPSRGPHEHRWLVDDRRSGEHQASAVQYPGALPSFAGRRREARETPKRQERGCLRTQEGDSNRSTVASLCPGQLVLIGFCTIKWT